MSRDTDELGRREAIEALVEALEGRRKASTLRRRAKVLGERAQTAKERNSFAARIREAYRGSSNGSG